jgi:hypothetical protein
MSQLHRNGPATCRISFASGAEVHMVVAMSVEVGTQPRMSLTSGTVHRFTAEACEFDTAVLSAGLRRCAGRRRSDAQPSISRCGL